MNSKPTFDYIFKLLLIGDSGVGKSSLLMRFCEKTFSPTFITTIGIDFKVKTITIKDDNYPDDKTKNRIIKLQIWDTAGQERFRTITTAYYRGAMGVLLVYDVTDKQSFNHIRNWIRDLQQHGTENVKKILIGNKADEDIARVITKEQGEALANEFHIKYFETSAKTKLNVKNAFMSLVTEIKESIPIFNTTPETSMKLTTEDVNRTSGCC